MLEQRTVPTCKDCYDEGTICFYARCNYCYGEGCERCGMGGAVEKEIPCHCTKGKKE